ncbi:MAG: DUF3277 family protein [Gammaproteobacteria bacterium]|nr:DUF3277 family protein [Gammaproteobacteria bacterium]
MATNTKLKVYDPSEVSITLGTITVEGYADGTFVTVEDDEDAYSMQVGSDGESTRSKSNNRGATITLTTLQGSSSNDLLSALHNLDRNSSGGAGIRPLLIKDNNGTHLYTAETAWVQKRPGSEFAREATGREWTIRTNNLVSLDGSNNAP